MDGRFVADQEQTAVGFAAGDFLQDAQVVDGGEDVAP